MTMSVATARNRNTHDAWHEERNIVNGKQAKRLRKIARALELPAETGYGHGGKLRRGPSVLNELTGQLVPGPPIPRPIVMGGCERRVIKEAKKIYMGKPITALTPEGRETTFADQLRGTVGKTIESQ